MIRQWKEQDSIKLRQLIREFLVSQNKLGSDILPSENNISNFLMLGFEQIRDNDDPHLVCEEAGELIGYTQMGAALGLLERKHKLCESFATYVKPEHEHKFIGISLFQACMPYLQKNKYQYCSSTVMLANTRMLKNMFVNPVIWPIKVILEGDLRMDSQFEDIKNNGAIRPLERRA